MKIIQRHSAPSAFLWYCVGSKEIICWYNIISLQRHIMNALQPFCWFYSFLYSLKTFDPFFSTSLLLQLLHSAFVGQNSQNGHNY